MENLIEELTKVNPSNLSKEGLKLFNKINEIIDRSEELEEENKIYALNGDNINLELHIKNKYIPKSLIKEKIEEYKKFLKTKNLDRWEKLIINNIIEVLEELLEEK